MTLTRTLFIALALLMLPTTWSIAQAAPGITGCPGCNLVRNAYGDGVSGMMFGLLNGVRRTILRTPTLW